jgi:uncharacterized membrane protein YeaQ/YmgE (transglycosylase-associated protein family)
VGFALAARSAQGDAQLNRVGRIDVGIVSWIVLGLIAGFIGSKLVNKTGSGIVMDIVLGVIGAVVGGYLATLAGFGDVTGVNVYSIIVSIVGAVIVLLIYRAVVART